jgi:hypothetical protein
MRAHVIDNGVVVNTVEVETLDALPGLVAVQGSEGIGWGYDGSSFTPPAPTPEPIPKEVTMRQARLALLDAGLLSSVQTAINSLQEPAKTKAQIEWDYSNALQRDNSFVSVLGVVLGLNEAALDSLFIAASKL